MPSTYKLVETILALLQFVSLIGLFVGRLRLEHWLIALPSSRAPFAGGESRARSSFEMRRF